MKTNQKYFLLAVATMLAVTAASIGSFSSAQTVTPLSCTENSSSVTPSETMTLTASGGNGTYSWSGQDLSVTNASGSQFLVNYPDVGTYAVMVTSGGLTATCNVNVVASAPASGALVCAPSVQTVILGQTAAVSASGGNGSYVWSAPDLTIADPNGSGFSANYATTGTHVLTVTSAGLSSSCDIVVDPSTAPVVTTPSLPNTGGGYGHW